MELVFNELSILPLSVDRYSANDRMVLYSKAVAEARKKGFRHIRTQYSANEISLTNDYSFHNWLFDKDFSEKYRNLFFGMLVQPFIKEDDVEIEEKYIEANYFFEDTENQISKQECLGLTSAYLSDTIAISFQSSPAWFKNTLKIIIEKNNDASQDKVNHIYSKECFDQASIADFIESITILNLVETNINPNDKSFHLTDHHGKQELNELWSRIKYSPFVIEGISIEWGGNSFYKKPQKDGKVDIVHLKSDKRYAIQIQTTGRNLRETEAIAEILRQVFDC